MFFEQVYLGCLAHASYLLGSNGVGVVIDPQRDVDVYLKIAAEQGFTIRHIFETHLHADFVSGHRELAERTGAKIYIGADAHALFPHVGVTDGQSIEFGSCSITILHTPGHTPESVCLLVRDSEKGTAPWAVFTGDTLFIGDVGRPDLSPSHTPQQLASMLFDSVHTKLLTLPDETLVYPAHGAGSLCGRNMRAERFSTIGTERLTNYALQIATRQEFVRQLTTNLPARPDYFRDDAEINRTGAPSLSANQPIRALTAGQLRSLVSPDLLLLDTRPCEQFAAEHVAGSVCISLTGQFASWAGVVAGLHTRIVIIAEEPERAEEARLRLSRVGIENVVGYLEGGISAWRAAGLPTGSLKQITVDQLHAKVTAGEPVSVLDVRREAEWNAGHIPNALWHALDNFPHGLPRLPEQGTIAVHCKSGYRSTIACSLLLRAGHCNVINIVGGYDAWSAANLPNSTDALPAAAG